MSKVFTLKYSSKLKSDSFVVSSKIRLGNILFIKVNDKDYTEAIKLTIHDLESRKIVYFFYNRAEYCSLFYL